MEELGFNRVREVLLLHPIWDIAFIGGAHKTLLSPSWQYFFLDLPLVPPVSGLEWKKDHHRQPAVPIHLPEGFWRVPVHNILPEFKSIKLVFFCVRAQGNHYGNHCICAMRETALQQLESSSAISLRNKGTQCSFLKTYELPLKSEQSAV